MYSSKIFEIFKNPTYAGGLQGSNGIGKYIDEECGDFVKIYLIIQNNKIVEAQFKTMGSTGAIVASNVVCGLSIGLSIEEARNLKAGDILEITGEYPSSKLYTVDFAIKGLNLALDDYFERIEKEEKGKVRKSKKQNKQNFDISSQNIEIETDVQKNDELTLNISQDEDLEEQIIEKPLYADIPNDELFSDQIPQQQEVPDLFEKYFSDFEKEVAQNNKQNATKHLEEARFYTPVVETKIIKDEDLPKLEEKKSSEKSSVSSAKAMFDAMFED